MAVLHRDAWKEWWRAEAAPTRWTRGHPQLLRAIAWQRQRPGLDLAELRLALPSPVFRLRLIVLRVDPAHFDWQLVEARDEGRPSWGIDVASPDAVFALNAGQFKTGRPWGWLVQNGLELQPPGFGPLSSALAIDGSGRVALVPFARLEPRRAAGLSVAFQSYPTLLEDDGAIPIALRTPDAGVDLEHRDTRLAVGTLRDGRLLIALTRFDIGGGLLRPVPMGPNVPEMAAIMGALGCSRAVMLDGGISSQLLVRPEKGEARSWPAYRRVPLGLEGRLKSEE